MAIHLNSKFRKKHRKDVEELGRKEDEDERGKEEQEGRALADGRELKVRLTDELIPSTKSWSKM